MFKKIFVDSIYKSRLIRKIIFLEPTDFLIFYEKYPSVTDGFPGLKPGPGRLCQFSELFPRISDTYIYIIRIKIRFPTETFVCTFRHLM